MKKVTLTVEKNEDGFWGQLVECPDMFSQGNTLAELKINCEGAYKMYIEDLEGKSESLEIEYAVDLTQFFAINNYINISNLADRIGINKSLLRQYSRGIKFPSMKQVERIQKAVQAIGKELMNTKLKPIA